MHQPTTTVNVHHHPQNHTQPPQQLSSSQPGQQIVHPQQHLPQQLQHVPAGQQRCLFRQNFSFRSYSILFVVFHNFMCSTCFSCFCICILCFFFSFVCISFSDCLFVCLSTFTLFSLTHRYVFALSSGTFHFLQTHLFVMICVLCARYCLSMLLHYFEFEFCGFSTASFPFPLCAKKAVFVYMCAHHFILPYCTHSAI